MTTREAAIAANRFGLGARPGELKQIASDPRGWLLAQIGSAPPITPAPLQDLASAEHLLAESRQARMDRRSGEDRQSYGRLVREVYRSEMSQRAVVAATTDQPFRERLIWFWSNHFCVSTTRGSVRPVAGAFEREAIRPNVCGRFQTLLLEAERHPAMQLYLDNLQSIGPNSRVGLRSGRGLNENHAREILELHTVGVHGGYTQADVENFAAILTGWGLVRGQGNVAGRFNFDAARHEPGAKKLLGHTYPEGGEGEGKAALRDLARNPATATHVATKLARHFVADDPPERAVNALATTFQQTGGDLAQVHAALVDLPEAWQQTHTKLKSPMELVISTARSLGYATDGEPMIESMRYLGQTPGAAPSPQGWSDTASGWLGPEAVLTRVEWAERVGEDGARRLADPLALATDLLGPLLSARTAAAIARAPSPAQALALFVASPDFQRR